MLIGRLPNVLESEVAGGFGYLDPGMAALQLKSSPESEVESSKSSPNWDK